MGDYALRPFTAEDLPVMADWLATPVVREWWGDPAEQLALVTADLGDPMMDQRFAAFDGTAFGYVQSYPCQHWGAPHFHDQPDDTRAMDTCVGVPAMLGKGHGSVMVRFYAQTLLAEGAPAVVIDPAPANEAAIACYRRAGFRDIAVRTDGDGAPALVMRFDPAFLCS
jgi:aminoglycoside 6'-N-acetyltransferase